MTRYIEQNGHCGMGAVLNEPKLKVAVPEDEPESGSAPGVPQLEFSSAEDSHSNTWLILVAWVAAIVGIGYFGMFALGMAMSAGGSSRLSVYEAVAVGIWPAIVAMAVLASVKQGALSRSELIGFAIPVFLVLPGVMMSLVASRGLWIIASIWIPPFIAFFFDALMQSRNKAGFALEVLLIGVLIMVPLRILTSGVDFGGTRAVMKRERVAYEKRVKREAYFMTLLEPLKAAMPKQNGPWRQTVTVGFKDKPLVVKTRYIQPQDGICVLYEHADSKPGLVADDPELQAQRLRELEAKLKEYEQVYEAIKGYDVPPNNWSPERKHRLDFLRKASEGFRSQLTWNIRQWQRWDDMENSLEVRVSLMLPGESVECRSTWAELASLESGSGILMPWTQQPEPGEERTYLDIATTCILGWTQESPQINSLVQNRTYGRIPFVLQSLGIRIQITARDQQKLRSFLDTFDLAPLKAIIRKPSVTLPAPPKGVAPTPEHYVSDPDVIFVKGIVASTAMP